jgi:hypothetical protein
MQKAKDKLKKCGFNMWCDAQNKRRRHVKVAQGTSQEDAVLRWYVQECSCRGNVWGAELKYAANTLENPWNSISKRI